MKIDLHCPARCLRVKITAERPVALEILEQIQSLLVHPIRELPLCSCGRPLTVTEED